MDETAQRQWLDEALDFILEALGRHDPFASLVVFKGARILELPLADHGRASFDLDMNLLDSPRLTDDRTAEADFIRTRIEDALRSAIDSAETAVYSLSDVSVTPKPRNRAHARGWNALRAKVRLRDFRRPDVLNFQTIELDIAAPERVADSALVDLRVGNSTIQAYRLETSAGVKFRALLTSLQPYREKMGVEGERSIRAKDVCDIARIWNSVGDDNRFWADAANHFRIACQNRLVDCIGASSFTGYRAEIEAAYASDAIASKALPFDQAWPAFEAALRRLTEHCNFPWSFPDSDEA